MNWRLIENWFFAGSGRSEKEEKELAVKLKIALEENYSNLKLKPRVRNKVRSWALACKE